MLRRVIVLIDLIRREVCTVDVGAEVRSEWSSDDTEVVPFDAVKEGVVLDFLRAVLAGLGTQTIAGVTKQAVKRSTCGCFVQ